MHGPAGNGAFNRQVVTTRSSNEGRGGSGSPAGIKCCLCVRGRCDRRVGVGSIQLTAPRRRQTQSRRRWYFTSFADGRPALKHGDVWARGRGVVTRGYGT
jgi:hypothetical protein